MFCADTSFEIPQIWNGKHTRTANRFFEWDDHMFETGLILWEDVH